MRMAVIVIVVVLAGAGCADDQRSALTTTDALDGAAEVTMASKPRDVVPLIEVCLTEVGANDGAPINSELCNEAALVVDEIGLTDLAADLRRMMTSVGSDAREAAIDRIREAISRL